jgi:hypothetical protein
MLVCIDGSSVLMFQKKEQARRKEKKRKDKTRKVKGNTEMNANCCYLLTHTQIKNKISYILLS